MWGAEEVFDRLQAELLQGAEEVSDRLQAVLLQGAEEVFVRLQAVLLQDAEEVSDRLQAELLQDAEEVFVRLQAAEEPSFQGEPRCILPHLQTHRGGGCDSLWNKGKPHGQICKE